MSDSGAVVHSNKISYRQDIDGLRAIAVLSVLFFHLNNSFLRGGFIGVDIFFVISGFLITKILIKDIEKDNFSFSLFYIKRIRRIFPALFTVLFACTIISALMLTDQDFKWFGKTLRYASLQISNMLFQKQVGYFDPAFDGMPLLHTWSLGVEEQFYLVWPMMLLLLFKFRKSKNTPFYGLIFISIISLAFSQYLISFDHQKIAFFSLPSRLWELGLGGILAFDKIKKSHNKNINESLGILGLVLIGISIFTIKSASFPGLVALLPCVGAALVIFSGNRENHTLTAKILSSKILVFIGLISYSLYLWHWPIIVFYKEYAGQENPSITTAIVISLIAIFISYLSWRFIENPFRKVRRLEDEKSFCLTIGRAKNKIKQFRVNLYTPIAIATLIIVSFVVMSKDIRKTGWSWRILKKGDVLLTSINDIPESDCTREWDNGYLTYNRCVVGNNKENPEVIIFGDSHSEHYSTAVIDWAKKRNLTVALLSSSGCPALFGVKHDIRHACVGAHERILDEINKSRERIKYVFIASRWSIFFDDTKTDPPLDTQRGVKLLIQDINSKETVTTLEKAKVVFEKRLQYTIDTIGGKIKIIILGEVPFVGDIKNLHKQYGGFPIISPPSLEYSFSRNKNFCDSTKDVVGVDCEPRLKFIRTAINKVVNANKNVTFFDPSAKFCDDKFCYVVRDDKVLYKDGDHLNSNGGHYVGKFFDFN